MKSSEHKFLQRESTLGEVLVGSLLIFIGLPMLFFMAMKLFILLIDYFYPVPVFND